MLEAYDTIRPLIYLAVLGYILYSIGAATLD
mgnify:CR=1 FL=1